MARRRDVPDERYENDFEERVESKRRRSRGPSNPQTHEKPKAPFLLRVLAWGGVILLCFVAGYIGTSYMLKLLEKQSFLKPEDRVQNQQDLETFLSADNAVDAAKVKLDMQKATVSLFYPRDGVLMEESAEIITRTREDNIQEVLHKLLELSGMFGKDVRVEHVFRNLDTVYLDFSGPFTSALTAAGAKPSTLFITGIVRTMRDNFSPISKIRFLVDSKIATAGSPVDLTATWQLPK